MESSQHSSGSAGNDSHSGGRYLANIEIPRQFMDRYFPGEDEETPEGMKARAILVARGGKNPLYAGCYGWSRARVDLLLLAGDLEKGSKSIGRE
ncbi:hypothetical protein [Alkalicoccus halolimnae]|uniref:Uncharacterized protein n=1 Tax=Alkalicoccus halolimnae TaxID=1667239 RepID=A0A5C7F6T5_9BACI|nr:hypothetical protein [Alkalicoccus halolimnae]TXF85290.1 hypothetical protein FTX54_08860 [Alkalicoccus halolimnae]